MQEGVAFCPNCHAPQIRVSVAGGGEPSSPTDSVSLPSPDYFSPSSVNRLQRRQIWRAATLGGLVGAIFMLLTVGFLGLGMLAGGSMSVVFYRRRMPGAVIPSGMGARLGLLSGMLGFIMLAAPLALASAFFHLDGEIQSRVVEKVDQVYGGRSDPQAQQLLELVKTPQGIRLFLGVAMILTFIASVTFATLGGAISAMLLRRKSPF